MSCHYYLQGLLLSVDVQSVENIFMLSNYSVSIDIAIEIAYY